MAVVVSPGYYTNDDDISHVSTKQFSIAQVATRILERNNRRIGAVIKNNGSFDVWVGRDQVDVTINGHIMSPKDTLALVSASGLWAYSPSGTNAMSVLEEMFRSDP